MEDYLLKIKKRVNDKEKFNELIKYIENNCLHPLPYIEDNVCRVCGTITDNTQDMMQGFGHIVDMRNGGLGDWNVRGGRHWYMLSKDESKTVRLNKEVEDIFRNQSREKRTYIFQEWGKFIKLYDKKKTKLNFASQIKGLKRNCLLAIIALKVLDISEKDVIKIMNDSLKKKSIDAKSIDNYRKNIYDIIIQEKSSFKCDFS